MKLISSNQITSKLSEYQIHELAQSTSFHLRPARKIDAVSYLAGFFMMLTTTQYSLQKWACQISLLIRRTVSKQAVLKKLQFRHESFACQVLDEILRTDLQKSFGTQLSSHLFKTFKEVYVEDSSCIHLPESVADYFPGSFSSNGKCATARIQLRLNLLRQTYSKLQLQSYRDNDQKYAPDIISVIQAGDLIIRDLGYWVLSVFGKIMSSQAYFLSRYRYGTYVYEQHTKQQIDLVKHLRSARRKGVQVWDQPVCLGKKAQLPVRIVAIKAPQQVVQSRKRKASKDRHKRANHSQAYFELLEWSIFITNVNQDTWSPSQILQAYGFRWRIEIVFKCWKSKLALHRLFQHSFNPGPAQVSITLHLFLAWLCLFFVRYYNFFLQAIFHSSKKLLSLMKFADFFKEHFVQLIHLADPKELVDIVTYFCAYDKRKSRPNQLYLLYIIN